MAIGSSFGKFSKPNSRDLGSKISPKVVANKDNLGDNELKPSITASAKSPEDLRNQLGLNDPISISSTGQEESDSKQSFSDRIPRLGASLAESGYTAASTPSTPQYSQRGGGGALSDDPTNYWGESFDDRRGWSLDPQMNLAGNTSNNDIYVRDAIANGASEDDLYDIMHRDPWWKVLGEDFRQGISSGLGRGTIANPRPGNGILGLGGSQTFGHPFESRNVYDINKDSPGIGSWMTIDDGSAYDYDHMTSDYMTGTQYLHYIEDLGMQGRPVEEISPRRIYSKRREALNYGFEPFTPDMMSAWNMAAHNASSALGRLGTSVANLRQMVLPSYTINYDGMTINGEDFDRLSGPYLDQIEWRAAYDPDWFEQGVKEYSIPDASGRMRHAYGTVTDYSYDGDMFWLEFADGQGFYVSPDYVESHMANVDGQDQLLLDNTFVPVSSVQGYVPEGYTDIYIPDMVMPDGTSLPYETVLELYQDDTPYDSEDDGISYDFLPFNMNMPSRLMEHELLSEEGDVDIPVVSNLLGTKANSDWFHGWNPIWSTYDNTMSSLPISISTFPIKLPGAAAPIMARVWSPWAYSASNAVSSMSGADPAQYDPVTDSYGMQAGFYDDDGNMRYGVNGNPDDPLKFWNTVGTMMVPATENLAGDISSDPIRSAASASNLIGQLPESPTLRQLVNHAAFDAAMEGIEEIVGIAPDELTTYGINGMYANPVYETDPNTGEIVLDESGNPVPVYDVTGHEIRDYDTSLRDRARNMFDPNDIMNAFGGGVAVDVGMNVMGLGGGDYNMRRFIDAGRNDLARRRTGQTQLVVNPDITPESLTDISDDEYIAELMNAVGKRNVPEDTTEEVI